MTTLLPIAARNLIRRTADALNVYEWELMEPGCGIKLAHGRYAVMLSLRDLGWSYPRIAAAVNRNHSSVISGLRRARRLRCTDPAFIDLLDTITRTPSHDFVAGVTDQGPPRAAKGGFPYPGHGPLAAERVAA